MKLRHERREFEGVDEDDHRKNRRYAGKYQREHEHRSLDFAQLKRLNKHEDRAVGQDHCGDILEDRNEKSGLHHKSYTKRRLHIASLLLCSPRSCLRKTRFFDEAHCCDNRADNDAQRFERALGPYEHDDTERDQQKPVEEIASEQFTCFGCHIDFSFL